MNEADRSSLELAVAAHREWLEQRGIKFVNPDKPDESLAPELLSAGEVLRVLAPHMPQRPVGVVATNLHIFCSLRVRAAISGERARHLSDFVERLAKSSEYLSDEAKARALKLVTFGHKEAHVQSVEPALVEVEKRLRTASKKLGALVAQLDGRHRKAIELGLPSGSEADVAMVEWARSRCDALEHDLAFVRMHLQGQQFAPEHEPLEMAWKLAMKSALVRLRAAGVDSVQRRALFPAAFPEPADRDENRQQIDRESKSRKRAKGR